MLPFCNPSPIGVGIGGLCSSSEDCGDDMICSGNPGNQMCTCREGYVMRLDGTCGEICLTLLLCYGDDDRAVFFFLSMCILIDIMKCVFVVFLLKS